MNDISYRQGAIFTAFWPNTKAGKEAWNEIARHTDGTGKVFTAHADSTILQLRAAGYTVGRARQSKADLEAIFDELY